VQHGAEDAKARRHRPCVATDVSIDPQARFYADIPNSASGGAAHQGTVQGWARRYHAVDLDCACGKPANQFLCYELASDLLQAAE